MSEEETIFSQDPIRITTKRAIFGAKTYAIANITSVSAFKEAKSMGVLVFFLLIGIVITYYAIRPPSVSGIGLVIGLGWIGAIIHEIRKKPLAKVRVSGSSGEEDMFQSRNHAMVQQIVDAVNQAMVRRG